MTSPATYGELMLKAALGVHRGIAQVQGLPFDRPEEAWAAVDGFYDVLRAVAAHTWRLLEPWRVPGLLSGQSPDPRERAAVHLGDALEDLVAQHPRPRPRTPDDWSATSQTLLWGSGVASATRWRGRPTHSATSGAGAVERSSGWDTLTRCSCRVTC